MKTDEELKADIARFQHASESKKERESLTPDEKHFQRWKHAIESEMTEKMGVTPIPGKQYKITPFYYNSDLSKKFKLVVLNAVRLDIKNKGHEARVVDFPIQNLAGEVCGHHLGLFIETSFELIEKADAPTKSSLFRHILTWFTR